MRAATALSTHPIVATALGECAGQVLEALGGARPTLAVVAVTPPHLGTLEDLGSALDAVLAPDVTVGAVASAVVGGEHRVEGEPALTLFVLSGVEATPLVLEPDGRGGLRWHGDRGDRAAAAAGLVLADPFSCPGPALVAALAGLEVSGGLLNTARGAGGSRLLVGGTVRTSGAVGALLGPPARAAARGGSGPGAGRAGPVLGPCLQFPGADWDGDGSLLAELAGTTAGVGVSAPLAPRAGDTALLGPEACGLLLLR